MYGGESMVENVWRREYGRKCMGREYVRECMAESVW